MGDWEWKECKHQNMRRGAEKCYPVDMVCPLELSAAVVIIYIHDPQKGKPVQLLGMGATGSWWLLEEVESLFFRSMATRRLSVPQ